MNRFFTVALAAGVIACTQTSKEPPAIDVLDMDTSVSPATDFDAYANGGWKKRNPMPDEKSRYGSFDKLADTGEEQVKTLFTEIAGGKHAEGSIGQKIADFYSSGMDTAAIEAAGTSPLQPYWKQVDAITSVADMQQVVIDWHRMQVNPLFVIYADADQKNSSQVIAYLHQGGLGMPDRDYYLNTDERSLGIQEKYRQFIAGLLVHTGSSKEAAAGEAAAIYELEKKMAIASMSLLDQRDPYKTYNKMTIAGLSALSPGYDWAGYFQGIGLNDPGELVVSQPEFFAGVGKLIQTEPLDTWKLYLKYQFTNFMADYLSKDIVGLNFDFYGKTLSGKQVDRPRWKKVQGTAGSALSEAVGQLYVKKYFPPEAKKRMIALVENLRVSLGERISQLEWMGDTTKQKAIEKLNAINVKVGYPDKWRDYSALQVEKGSYVQNVLNSGMFDFTWMMGKVNKPVDKSEWYMPPQMVNAYYNPSTNEIVFPAAILQPPFFYMNAEDAVNYGAIGVVIGHEMTHGFDDQGRQYDKDGNLNDWWTAQDAERFNGRTAALVNQYSQFTVLDTIKADGKLTLGENIADLGGLNIAYQALRHVLKGDEKPIDGFTPEQRFFLAYAHIWAQNIRDEEMLRRTKIDVHSLGRYRVLGPLRNLPEFYTAFNVKEGDAMYLAESDRAVIW
ncbi:MAG TPA: peptidase M13 [Prolixibacteraceae bacterium]|nr:peptidase M13 [Prolixibacteraceae bacterium]HCR89012.1 peptidase M13 [Prolixibacteraceae bacterium]HCU61312.1 peptidase M13 [Prolixibacteraceae bacterium]